MHKDHLDTKYRNISILFNAEHSQFFEGPISSLHDDENNLGCIAFNCPDPVERGRLRRIVVHPRQFLYLERGPVIEELKR